MLTPSDVPLGVILLTNISELILYPIGALVSCIVKVPNGNVGIP